ncbi:MAG: undecaprenyl-phosphate galactose phosphotransferase WbaP [Nitrospirota bacterium]
MLKKRLGTVLLFIIDITAVFFILQISIFLRKNILPYFLQFPEFPVRGFVVFVWVLPVWLLFFVYEGLYTKRFSFWDEIKVLWKSTFFSTLAVFSILYLGKVGEQVSRTVIVLMGFIAIPILPLIRLNAKKFLMNAGLIKSKALILGAGKTGELMLNALRRDANLAFDVVGFLDDDPRKIGQKIGGVKIHGNVDKAQKYVGRYGIQDIIIAMPSCDSKRLAKIINSLQHNVQNILFIPDLFGIAVLGTKLQHFFQEQAIGLEVSNNLAAPVNIFTKRVFDLTASLVLLVVFFIPMIVIALLTRINSKGGPIFSQERIGKDDKPFKCYKFRTMHHDAEEKFDKLIKKSPEASSEWERNYKLKDDPRITKVGAFLRKTSLDELPQLLNVLKGEMSLVGPRPVTRKEIDDYYQESAKLCFGVPPGITGLWQVSGRSSTGYPHRVALDSWYVRNWNLWLDIVILLKTVKIVIKKEGAW